jgi:DHA2 family multidrug resistance protein
MMKQGFIARGYSLEEAEMLANRSMEGVIFKQQAMVSYNQGFFMVALIVLILFPVVYLVRNAKKDAPVTVNDAH